MPSFAEATAVTQLGSHTYTTTLEDAWCIGTVPHGGYIISIFQSVARTHFSTTLAHVNQPHTLTLHLEFLRRTAIGPGSFTVKDVKLGGNPREEIVGYASHSNLSTEEGITIDMNTTTRGVLHPSPYAADLPRLMLEGKDDIWCQLVGL
ncbi:hypothetical protein DL98DRAFT_593038 [Cadophora sp. DSE1049]|nr:hypothetical protein DL98DRAFT_593038 [Cadophora sp. DSE1049]